MGEDAAFPGDLAYRFLGHFFIMAGVATLAAMPVTQKLDLGFMFQVWIGAA